MPLYEYRCKACGHRFEKIQTYSAPDEKECPVCHAEVVRLISAPSVQFKGSGFYSTDYGSRGSKSAAAEGKAESAGDGGSAKVVEGGGASDKSSSADKGSSDKGASSGDKSSVSSASSSPGSSSPAAPSKP